MRFKINFDNPNKILVSEVYPDKIVIRFQIDDKRTFLKDKFYEQMNKESGFIVLVSEEGKQTGFFKAEVVNEKELHDEEFKEKIDKLLK